jgi:threonine dehydratase
MSDPTLITLTDIEAAANRIAGTAVRTPLVPLPAPARPGLSIWLKDESAQPIGAFKIRGAYNMVSQLTPEELSRGVITYSSGNHAQGVAYAARALGSKAVIVMPDNSPQVKIHATRALGAEIVFVGPASSERRLRAEELAAAHGYTIIPPYDHARIIAGQATCGLEIAQQMPDADLILSPVSGGGLLSGTATAIKLAAAAGRMNSAVQVWGCEPALAADATESFYARTLIEWSAGQTSRTLADGLRTQSLGVLNFEHILRFVDGIVTVTEEEILAAMHHLLAHTNVIPEPSGAVTLAAALFHAQELPAAEKIVVIVSGGNVDPKLLDSLRAEAATV